MRRITIEEYIEKIYVLQNLHGTATTGRIAEEMNIKPPSVTQMLQKLSEEGLVDYNPYQGAVLTSKGEEKAKALMKSHRTISDFLVLLGIDARCAEDDACRVEHHISKETCERLRDFVHYMNSTKEGNRMLSEFSKWRKERD